MPTQQIERLEQVWDRFQNLKVQDLEGDEILYREMRDRFGLYFEGGMGAEAIQKRLEAFDLDAEAELLREIIATGKGQKQDPCAQAPQGRHRVPDDDQQRPTGMVLDVSRSSRRTCARWCSSTVAASRPPTSTTCTVA